MTLPPTLTLNYWFTLTPPPFTPFFGRLILITFIAMTVLGIVAYVVRVREGVDTLTRRVLQKTGSALLWTGLIGLLLYSFEYERVTVLTMRFAYLVLGLWFIWRLWTIYRYTMRDIPKIRKQEQDYKAFTQWLPKKKRK